MSLVNDVLRQIDQNSHSQEAVKSALPLPLQTNVISHDKTQVVILSLTVFIIIIYLFQLFFIWYSNEGNIPINRIEFFQSNNNENESDLLINANFIEPDALESVALKLEFDKEVQEEATLILMANIPESTIANDVQKLPVDVLNREIIIESPVSNKKTVRDEIIKPFFSNKTISKEYSLYQEALALFISGNIKKSENILRDIIDENSKEEYLELQARIYINKSDADGFYQFVKTHSENRSTSWYKLIAPGLQLFSYYKQSNNYYDVLIKIEPDQMRWRLAMALNYSRLGENEKSIIIYRNLARSDTVSDKQRKWLIKRIKRLTLSKA